MKLDDFESVFRSAVKARFHLQPPQLQSILLVTDMSAERAEVVRTQLQEFLSSIHGGPLSWRTVNGDSFGSVPELMRLIEHENPDLVVCYRHLCGQHKELPHSLGAFVDTITQATRFPVMLLPPPTRKDFDARLSRLQNILVVTDHLTGDDRLVNWGIHMCPEHGKLVLAHVEDEIVYRRYVELIGMIPDADTETTTRRLTKQLLSRPADYIRSIIAVLKTVGVDERVVPLITMGHKLNDYKRIIAEQDIDLVIFNTKDAHQLAMHGMAYAIAVEIQERSLLLL